MKPLLAILAADDRQPFRGNQTNFAALIRTARTRGHEVVVTTPFTLRDSPTNISCFRLLNRLGRPRWEQTTAPNPMLFYNRLPDRAYEQRSDVQQILKHLQEDPSYCLFNPRFFNKWRLFQQIKQSPTLAKMLPETANLDTFAPLQQMLRKHKAVVAKPTHGKAGIGMMRISRLSKGYRLQYQNRKERRDLTFSHPTALWKTVQTLKGRKDYVVQQFIPLAQYQQRPFDLRALLQKNGYGRWTLTGVGVRVAGAKAISTHVPMGGRIAPLSTVIAQTPISQQQLQKRLEESTLALAQYIDQQETGLLGEMSMDIGLEENGRLWFFEANAKPMKFDEPAIRRRSLHHIIDFALYLQRQQRSESLDAHSPL